MTDGKNFAIIYTMIIKGSLNYDRHGRKIKRKKVSKSSGVEYKFAKAKSNTKKQSTKSYPSAKIGEYKAPKDTSWKVEASKKYTVAPAYNKGAYQVIPREDVKHIGK